MFNIKNVLLWLFLISLGANIFLLKNLLHRDSKEPLESSDETEAVTQALPKNNVLESSELFLEEPRIIPMSRSRLNEFFTFTPIKPGHFQLKFLVNNVTEEYKVRDLINIRNSEGSSLEFTIVSFQKYNKNSEVELHVSHQTNVSEFQISTYCLLEADNHGWREQKIHIPTHLVVERPNFYLSSNKIEMSLLFNFPVTSADIYETVSFDPPVEFFIKRNDRNRIVIGGDFEIETVYRLHIDGQLSSKEGYMLSSDINYIASTPKPSPYFSVLSKGPYFPSSSFQNIPVDVFGLDALKVEVFKVSEKNFLHFLKSSYRLSEFGLLVKEYIVPITGASKNKKLVLVDTSSEDFELSPGVYKYVFSGMTRDSDGNLSNIYRTQSRILIASDLAIQASKHSDFYRCWVTSLKTGKPVKNAEVTLFSYQYDEILNASTDENGLVDLNFDPDSNQSPFAVGAHIADDNSILQLNFQNDVNLRHHFGEDEGKPILDRQYDAHVYSERGIYRPGDKVYFSALTRSGDLEEAITQLPVAWKLVKQYQSKALLSSISQIDSYGFLRAEFDLPETIQTGAYEIIVHSPGDPNNIWGSEKIYIKFFKPDTFKISKTNIPENLETWNDKLSYTMSGQGEFLFGSPTPDFKTRLDLYPRAFPSRIETYPGYSFQSSADYPRFKSLIYRSQTNIEGTTFFQVRIPNDWKNYESFQCVSRLEIRNPTGEFHEKYQTLTIWNSPYNIGIQFQNESFDNPEIKWVAINKELKKHTLTKPTEWRLLKENIGVKMVRSSDGSVRWQRDSSYLHIAQGTLEQNKSEGSIFPKALEVGRYRIIFSSDGKRIATRDFYHGQYAKSQQINTDPRILDLTVNTTDSESPIEIGFWAPIPGVSRFDFLVGRDVHSRIVTVKEGQNTITFPYPETNYGSAHVHATYLPAPNSQEGHMLPKRLMGRAQIPLDRSSNLISVSLQLAKDLTPGNNEQVAIELSQNGNPISGGVHLFGVDKGILSQTHSTVKNPHDWFFGPRQMPFKYHDVFDSVFEDPLSITKAQGVSTQGGGAGGGSFLNPFKRELEDLAVFSLATIPVDASGKATTSFVVPNLDGELKIFAVAANEMSYGASQQSVKVTHPISVHLGSPLVVTPNDEFYLSALITNQQSQPENCQLEFELSGLSWVSPDFNTPASIQLEPGVTQNFIFPLKASKDFVGNATFKLKIQSSHGSDVFESSVSSRPGIGRNFHTSTIKVQPGESWVGELKAPFIPATSRMEVSLNDAYLGKITHALRWLKAYPYGCLEQTVSGTFPYLYQQEYSQKSENIDIHLGNTKVQNTLRRLEYHFWNGSGFSMWGRGGDHETWNHASLYASYFIAVARNRGFKTSDEFVQNLKQWLISNTHPDKILHKGGTEEIAESLYILSLLGESRTGYIKALLKDQNTNGRAKLLLIGALHHSNERSLANDFAQSISIDEIYSQDNYGLGIRTAISDVGQSLSILSQINSDLPIIPKLLEYIGKNISSNGHWGTTFSNSMVCLGVGEYLNLKPNIQEPEGMVIYQSGESVTFNQTNPFNTSFEGNSLPIKVVNQGQSEIYLNMYASGISTDILDATNQNSNEIGHEFSLIKEYSNPRLASLPPDWKLGESVEVSIEIPSGLYVENLVVVDLFPGCLQLHEQDSIKTTNFRIKNIDRREDRLIIFGDKLGKQDSFITYMARVAHPGSFKIPPAFSEAMYEPSLHAKTNHPDIIVVDQDNER